MTRKRVLVVDDEAVMRDGCQRILAKGGCEVISACNGEEGLAAIQEDPQGFGVVLLDLKMPGMSGIEVLEAARRLAEVQRGRSSSKAIPVENPVSVGTR